MTHPHPNLEPPVPTAQELCICGLNAGKRTPCPDCRALLCEECEQQVCHECLECVCPRHLRNVIVGGVKRPTCGICFDRFLEDGEACQCDREDCEWCREQARRRQRRDAEREAIYDSRMANLILEALGE